MSEKVELPLKADIDLKNVVVPEEVKEAWETVAKFLNTLPELSFSVSPWRDNVSSCGESKYTLHAGGKNHRDLQIVAKSEWRSEDKQ